MDPQAGSELGDVETKDIGFQDVASTSGARLKISQPWSEDSMPPVTASLLSIASKKGLMAAATPDGLIIAKTEKVTQQYLARRKDEDESDKVRDLQADARIPVPRVSHVAFSADESCLIIAAQQGGGLAVYETNKLDENAQPAFQIATNGTSIRHILANPNPSSDTAHLFGVVLSDGKLLLADLQSRSLVNGPQGSPVFHENVSSAAWSKMGKQIIAGLADSTCVQLDPKGNIKDQIPRPPQLQELQADYEGANGLPITSISWISNYEFLLVFSPSYPDGQEPGITDSAYFIAHRTKGTPFTMQRISLDPTPPFGATNRNPSHHFLLRFVEWLNIKDMYIVASSSSTDIGVLAHFFASQEKGLPDEFVTAVIPEDRNQKAMMPWSDELSSDTSPVGAALDLGSKIVAPRPVYNEADLYPHSTIPLPALYMLGNDGILLMWWMVYNDAIKSKVAYPGMVHKNGRFAKYKKFNKVDMGVDASNPHAHEQAQDDSSDEQDVGDASAAGALPATSTSSFGAQPAADGPPAFGTTNTQSSQFQQSAFGAFSSGQPAAKPAFGQPGGSGFGATGALGQPASPWGVQSAGASTPGSLGHTFGQPSTGNTASPFGQKASPGQTPAFGQTSQPSSASPFGKPATPGGTSPLGQVSSMGSTPAFGKPSAPASFGQPSPIGGAGAFGHPSAPAAFGKPSTPAAFGKPSGLGGFGQSSTLFGGNASSASPFMTLGNNKENKANPFTAFANQKSPLSKQESTASTATIGSSFGSGSAFAGSSFGSKPTISQESTMRDDDEPSKPQEQASTGFGLGSSGFKLGSGFKGDGTAKDDLPMPKNPGAGLFGGDMFGKVLDEPASTKPSPFIKQEPGTEEQPQLKNIPLAQPTPQQQEPEKEPPLPSDFTKSSSKGIPDDAPLPPDPSSVKAIAEDAPLPPDPSTYKAPKMDDFPLPSFGQPSAKQAEKDFPIPSFSQLSAKRPDKDVPIAGSPPVDVTNSQTFSSAGGSEAAGPSDEDSADWDDEDDSEGEDDEDEDDHGNEEDDEDDEDEDDEEAEAEEVTIGDPARLQSFMNRITPASPKRQKTPESEEKTIHSSYTPAGVPPGPIFEPPKSRPILSPRSPSPRRTVTSPARTTGVPQDLPPQIKTSAIPPGKPVPRPAPLPKKPREPTQGELQDEADARLKAYLAAPPEPTKDLPKFYTHADYEGDSSKPNIGGQIERVFRDVNSMVDVVGLNAKGLDGFLLGHETLRKQGQRTREDLDDDEAWTLGDIPSLTQLIASIDRQLEDGKLEGVRGKLEDLHDEQKELVRLKIKTAEMRKHIAAHTDAERLALQEAAPLSAETLAQQIELRQRVQRVQTLLSDVEQKMTMLRADLASLAHKDKATTAMPTVEAVTNTILKMTSMVAQKSGDIDVLEAQIRRLPHGIASLRLADDYEDDLARRLAGNRLLTASSSSTRTRTPPPPRRARMAANGDPLGMSAMFGAPAASRFQTPPSARLTPRASALGRSAGSLSASTRRKKMMADVTTEEVAEYHARVGRRDAVLRALRGQIAKRGVGVVRVAE